MFGWSSFWLASGMLLASGVAARAQVALTCDKPYLLEGERCTLRATVAGGTEPSLRWRLQGQEDSGPCLKPASRTGAWFTAPAVADGASFTVVAEAEHDPALRATLRFQARKRPGGLEDPVPALVPEAFAPALSWFLGDPAAPGEGASGPLSSRIAFCDAAFEDAQEPAVRRLHRCWIVAGARGLQAFSLAGEQVPLPECLQLAPGQVVHALAAMPSGVGLIPVDAPRLVVAVSKGTPGAATRIIALGCGGVLREWSLAEPGEARRTVRGLALDRDGSVFVGFMDDRDILRLDLAGNAFLHARLPDSAPPEPGGGGPGLLAMVLDAATGDLIVGDGAGLHRVDFRGLVTPVLPAQTVGCPGHLALRGRDLVIADALRPVLHRLHLDTLRRVTILGEAEGHGPAGALAITPEGWCLLAVGQGYATLALAEEDDDAWGEAREAAPPPSPALVRQQRQERFWALQREIRSHEKKLRRLRGSRAPDRARGIGKHKRDLGRLRRLADQLGTAEAPDHPPEPQAHGRARAGGGLRVSGLCCAALLGLAYLASPAEAQVLGQNLYLQSYGSDSFSFSYSNSYPYPLQPSFSSFSSFAQPPAERIAGYTATALAGVNQLGTVCDGPVAALLGIPACGRDARAGVQGQITAIATQMSQLFVEPSTLGAGECLRGETPADAKERIALAQSDQLVRFDQLNADAGMLSSQLSRDGNLIQVAAGGLLAGGAIAAAVLVNVTLPQMVPALVLEETGNSLFVAGFGLEGAAEVYGQVAFEAQAYQARYQRFANSQNRALLNCTGIASGQGAGPTASTTPLALATLSPLSAMADALAKLQAGCALAGQHGLSLAVCTPQSLSGLRHANGTLAGIYRQGIPCLAAGLLGGDQAPCPRLPLADYSRVRTDTFSYLTEFSAETSMASSGLFGLGYGFLAGSEGLIIAAEAAETAGGAGVAQGLFGASDGLLIAANGLFADGYDLLRIAAAMRGVQASVTLQFNAESRARLDQREAQALARTQPLASNRTRGTATGGGTGPGASSSTGQAPAGTTGRPDSSTALARPVTSSALRARPFLPRWVFLWLL